MAESGAYKRAIALKEPVNALHDGEYHQSGGEYEPNYVELDGERVSRINIIARVRKKNGEIFLEDDTGSIRAKSFDKPLDAEDGITVRVIGKIREAGGERFIAVETITSVDERELKLRQLELGEKPGKALKKEESKKPAQDDLEVEIEELEI